MFAHPEVIDPLPLTGLCNPRNNRRSDHVYVYTGFQAELIYVRLTSKSYILEKRKEKRNNNKFDLADLPRSFISRNQ